MLLQIVLLLPETNAQSVGLKIYVSVAGKDSNPGTEDQPLASLSQAVNKLRVLKKSLQFDIPSEVIIGNGDYFLTEPLTLGVDDSGTEKSPVIFKAEEGAHPVFYWGKKIEGFEKVSETLCRAKIPEVTEYGWYFEQLYINGERAIRAKSPNNGFYYLKDEASETAIIKSKDQIADFAVQKIRLYQDGLQAFSTFSATDFDNAVLSLYYKWDNRRKHVVSFEPDSSAIFTVGGGMKPWNKLNDKTIYTIENYKAALDTCGEWYLDPSGYLYYMPRLGETIENLNVIAPVASQFIVLKGDEKTGKKVENIRFEGLSFQVSGYKMPVEGNEPSQAAFQIEASVMADFTRNIQFINCEIAHTGTNAIWFRKACSDCRVEHCYLHDLGAGGIKIGDFVQPVKAEDLTQNVVADNNIIQSGGFVFPCAVGVTLFNTSDDQITHNEIADFRYSGFSVGWVWGYSYSPSKRNKIEFNHIHHLGWGELSDMGAVYCLGESEGTTVSNNVIHDVYSCADSGWGLYTDEGSTGIVMEKNMVYNCKTGGFNQHYGKENIIRNNIFANNMKAQIDAGRVEDHLSFSFMHNIVCFSTGSLLRGNWDKFHIQSDYNCYWDTRTEDIRFKDMSLKEWQKTGKDVHSIIADPEFANPSNFDFRIKNKSVLRKTGFKVFDYSLAGVYGTDEWRKLAVLNPIIVKQFDRAVLRNEKRGQK